MISSSSISGGNPPTNTFLENRSLLGSKADPLWLLGEDREEEKKPEEKTEDKKPNTIVIKDNSTSDKDINAEVMKEVISLDKKEEQIDETQTLDNFFTDIQSIANPTMEPIKEETKYTLFEDANASE